MFNISRDLCKQRKALRIGVVDNGRLVEEHIMKPGRQVTVGRRPGNNVVLTAPSAPDSVRLLSFKRGQYVLRFHRGQRGAVAVDSETLDLKTIAIRRLAQRNNDEFQFPLPESSRGKVVIGESTLLFQFVKAPRPTPRIQLPAEVRASLTKNWDRTLFSTFLVAALALGGPGASLETWWRHSGKFLAPTKKERSALLERLPTALVTIKTEPEPGPSDAPDGQPNTVNIQENPVNEELVEADPSPEGEQIVDQGDSVPAATEVSFDAPDQLEDQGEVAFNVAELQKRMAEEFKPVRITSTTVKAPDAWRRPGPSRPVTVVDVLGSPFGVGEGNFSDTARNGVRIIKNQNNFATGDLVTHGGSVYDDGEDGDLASTANSIFKNSDFRPGGKKKVGSLLDPSKVGIDPEKGPRDLELKGPAKQLASKKKKSESNFGLTGLDNQRKSNDKRQGRASATVSAFIKSNSSILRRCYVKVSRVRPEVKGKLILRIRISAAGKVTVRLQRRKAADPELAACISGVLKRWDGRYPEAQGPASFSIPLVFRAAN